MHFTAPMTCIMLHACRQVNAWCIFFQISGWLRFGVRAQGGGDSRSKAPRRRERAPNKNPKAQPPSPIDCRATARSAWKLCDKVLPLVSTDRSAFE